MLFRSMTSGTTILPQVGVSPASKGGQGSIKADKGSYGKALGVALTPDGEYLGEIMEDGTVVNKQGEIIGHRTPDGLIMDNEGTLIGIEEVSRPQTSTGAAVDEMFVPQGTFGTGGAYGTGTGPGENLGAGGGFGAGDAFVKAGGYLGVDLPHPAVQTNQMTLKIHRGQGGQRNDHQHHQCHFPVNHQHDGNGTDHVGQVCEHKIENTEQKQTRCDRSDGSQREHLVPEYVLETLLDHICKRTNPHLYTHPSLRR